MDNLAGYIDESLCLDHRWIVLLSSWVLVLGRRAGVCKLEHAEACWMGETYRDASDSNQTPQRRKTFWTATNETPVLCMCMYHVWAREWFETWLHHPYGETLPGSLHLTNPMAPPNKQKNILIFHLLVLYQKVPFPCTVENKMFYNKKKHWISGFLPWQLQIPVPCSCSQCTNPTPFCVPYCKRMLMV